MKACTFSHINAMQIVVTPLSWNMERPSEWIGGLEGLERWEGVRVEVEEVGRCEKIEGKKR